VSSIAPADAVRTLDERARRAREAREADRRACLERVLAAGAPIVARAHGRAWLIGSVVWGGFFNESDVDLVVVGFAPAAALELERAVARAGGRAVDVLELGSLPDAFRARVLGEGVEIR
jgi:predicted nucleotidyltransferase